MSVKPSETSPAASAHVLRDVIMHIGKPGTTDKEIEATLEGRIVELNDDRLIMEIHDVPSMSIHYSSIGTAPH